MPSPRTTAFSLWNLGADVEPDDPGERNAPGPIGRLVGNLPLSVELRNTCRAAPIGSYHRVALSSLSSGISNPLRRSAEAIFRIQAVRKHVCWTTPNPRVVKSFHGHTSFQC